MTTIFETPQNKYREEVISFAFLWCVLFGCLYLLVKGNWIHFVLSATLAISTAGLVAYLLFFVRSIIVNKYRRKSWREIRG